MEWRNAYGLGMWITESYRVHVSYKDLYARNSRFLCMCYHSFLV